MSESIKKSTIVDAVNALVTVTRTTKHPAKGNIVCDWKLDFANVEPKRMLELATRAVVIDMQRELRAVDDVTGLEEQHIDVNGMYDNKTRATRNPFAKVIADTTNMSHEQKMEYLQKIGVL